MDVKLPNTQTAEADAAKDKSAGREVLNFDRLDQIDSAKHKIVMGIHAVLAFLIPASIVLFFLLYWVGVVIYAYHMIATGWMPEAKIHELRAVLFSGFVGAVISQGLKKFMS